MSSPNNSDKKQMLKKYAVFAAMGLICLGSIWMIFKPSESDIQKEQEGLGFNADIPDPNQNELIGDKRDAYEQDQMKQKQQERMKNLQDMSFMFAEETQKSDLNLMDESNDSANSINLITANENARPKTPINTSVSAYQDINKTLGSFYEQPKDDPEKEEMKKKLEELEAKMQESDNAKNTMDEQMALMEKSYEMAARYMPQGQNQGEPFSQNNNSLKSKIDNYSGSSGSNNGKTKVAPIKQFSNQTVSALQQERSYSEMFAYYDQVKNTGFNTMGGESGLVNKNTIAAIIDQDQTLVDGQSVRLRLIEPLMAGNTFVPENTILTGQAKIQGERLEILIVSIEHQGMILPVEMTVFDSDGQKGIYIPGSLELNAGKEIVANMGNSMGTSFTMTQSASSQIASDVSKGAIQGISAYMQKKIRQVKVNLKAGYRIMLMPKQ